jgi:ubiquinone/menaquinone biosynthesis C-methylase UbiE
MTTSGSLCLGGGDSPLSTRELQSRLASGPIWIWVRGEMARAPIVADGDGLEVSLGEGGALAIVDDGGQAMVAAHTKGIARVTRIWRAHREYDVTHGAWRLLAVQSTIFGAADRVARLAARVRDLGVQWRAEPPATQATVYAAPVTLEVYARSAGAGLSETEEEIAKRHLTRGQRLLDVGCGTGREAFGFAARGLTVIGVDTCAPEIAFAREEAARRGGEVRFLEGDLEELTLDAGSFDVAFLASEVYATIPGRERRVAALRLCARFVRPGGLVIVAAFTAQHMTLGGRILLDAPRRLVRRLARRAGVSEDVVPEPGDRRVRDGAPGGPVLWSFRHRFASDDEIAGELGDAGLSAVDRVSSYWITRVPAHRYRTRADVVVEPKGDELVLVQLGHGAVFTLNATGGAIYRLAGEAGLDREAIAARLAADTGASIADTRRDTAALLDELCVRGLLDVVSA